MGSKSQEAENFRNLKMHFMGVLRFLGRKEQLPHKSVCNKAPITRNGQTKLIENQRHTRNMHHLTKCALLSKKSNAFNAYE